MERRSPRVPAELAPFFSQHHKWSWSRPERSTVRLPLCADSIRNNCILASLHSSPFTTMVWHFTVFLCCKLQHGPRASRRTLQHCCYCYFFEHPHSCGLDGGVALTRYEKVFLSSTCFRQPQPFHLQRAAHFKCYPYLTSCPTSIRNTKSAMSPSCQNFFFPWFLHLT